MKFSTAIIATVAATASAAAPACEMSTLSASMAPIIVDPSYTACTTASGYDILGLALGTLPTADQAKKLVADDNCGKLYKLLQEAAGKHTPDCSLAGIDLSVVAKTDLKTVLAKMSGGAAGAATTAAPGATTAAPGATTAAPGATTAAPTTAATGNSTAAPGTSTAAPSTAAPKSGAASAGLALAAVAVAAALH
ncbi:hypothetical protein ACHHYP_07959 [Achlya hypogyna]|uniref:Elicitin n=1 Tax=Achlya hypogyna TaxID=1202772 RepID=A0A0A7CNU0_ACHHY|nr:secreted protein [Achlya hypogyna]OQR87907.1 hypothetical protein ACHHYP_07959 [Achlya hypogyna]